MGKRTFQPLPTRVQLMAVPALIFPCIYEFVDYAYLNLCDFLLRNEIWQLVIYIKKKMFGEIKSLALMMTSLLAGK